MRSRGKGRWKGTDKGASWVLQMAGVCVFGPEVTRKPPGKNEMADRQRHWRSDRIGGVGM